MAIAKPMVNERRVLILEGVEIRRSVGGLVMITLSERRIDREWRKAGMRRGRVAPWPL